MNDVATSQDSGDRKGNTLLCVDDEPFVLSALQRLFRRDGYQVLLANSATEGLEILEDEPVDLVISDMRMPVMDGAAFLKQVRARWPDTVRILLTGYASPDALDEAISAGGVYRCVDKPWGDEDLLHLVRQAVETRGAVRE